LKDYNVAFKNEYVISKPPKPSKLPKPEQLIIVTAAVICQPYRPGHLQPIRQPHDPQFCIFSINALLVHLVAPVFAVYLPQEGVVVGFVNGNIKGSTSGKTGYRFNIEVKTLVYFFYGFFSKGLLFNVLGTDIIGE
jgi:hypothetical protein